MKNIIVTVAALFFPFLLCAQDTDRERSNKNERSSVRKGNKEYENKNYVGAEIDYRKALEAAPLSGDATFNLGDALYEQQKYDDAAKEFEKAINSETDPVKQSEAWYNLGNTYMKNQKYAEGIEAYKNALRKNPKDEDARYNLRLAQLMLKKNNQHKQKKHAQKEKQKKQQKQQKHQQPPQEQQQKEDNQQPNSPTQMTEENAQQILDALQQDERNTQEKVRKAIMEQYERRRTDKEW